MPFPRSLKSESDFSVSKTFKLLRLNECNNLKECFKWDASQKYV